MNFLPTLCLIIGLWSVINGVLHDIFVLRSEHGKQYDRNLLRLLMDGHILLTCGSIQLIASWGLKTSAIWSYYTGIVACSSLLIYCAMIFPFLKSIGTIALNLFLLMMLIYGLSQIA